MNNVSTMTSNAIFKQLDQLDRNSNEFANLVTHLKNDRQTSNRLFVSIINNLDTSEEKKIENVLKLVSYGLQVNAKLILKCEEMYGISQKIKAILEQNKDIFSGLHAVFRMNTL